MEVSSAVVVLLFVIAIFSSFNSKGHIPPKVQENPPAMVSTITSSIDAINPGYSEDDNARSNIKQYILKYRSQELADEISTDIVNYSRIYNVNPKLVAALMARESRFNPRALSLSGAAGLGQLLPSTCKTVGIDDAFDIEQNCKGTVKYLSYLLGRFINSGHKVSFAIAGYLEGPNGVERTQSYSTHAAAYINDILSIYSQI